MDGWRHQPIEPGWLPLGPGERVLWTGNPGVGARYSDPLEWMVLIGWTGAAGILGRNVVGRWRDLAGGGIDNAELLSALVLTALVIGIVVYATVGRWLQARARTERIQYVLTNRRAAIRDEDADSQLLVTDRRLTPDMELWPSIRKNGRGSITFATVRPPSTGQTRVSYPFYGYGTQTHQVKGGEWGVFRFEGLKRADLVLALMAEAVTAQMSDTRHPQLPKWVVEGRRYGIPQPVQDD